jgi:hypothetical protein
MEMAKVIKYKFVSAEINVGTKESPQMEQVFLDKCLSYNEYNEEIAKKEAYNGEYTIEDDGELGPSKTPTQLDRLESQVAYLAMMTGHSDILEV